MGASSEKEDKEDPINSPNPKKTATIPMKTMTIAKACGTFLFSNHVIGCAQMMLMKSAINTVVTMDLAYIAPAMMMIKAATVNAKGIFFVDEFLFSISSFFIG